MAHKKQIVEAVARDMKGRTLNRTLTQHNFRMDENDYRRLQKHFDNLGVGVGSGIRMIIKKYMQSEGI